MDLDFDGRVVVVTGAGNGLGRSHAKLFAQHGARVVVNDLGGDAAGGGASKTADVVVDEIRGAGGTAVASYDSVVDGEKIVETALEAFGRIDVVVNNAGILRDVTFHKMSQADWDLVYQVHVLGAMKVTHAAWPHLRDQKYGRIINTASAAGIYGNFGQANYSMAKLGLHGLTNTLAVEGRTKGVHVNTIAPLAASRLTESVLPPNLFDALDPEYVSPLVVWLCHEDCDETGGLYEVGGGYVGKLRWQRAEGKMWRVGRPITAAMVRDAMPAITDFETVAYPDTVTASLGPIIENVGRGPSQGGNELIDVDEALGYEYPSRTSSYDERDLALYALGVGAARDPSTDLSLVYEAHGSGFFAIPSYGVVPAINEVLAMAKEGVGAPGLNYGFDRVLHGEQMTKLERPLPPKATLRHEARITNIIDKGKGALVETTFESFDEDGELLVTNVVTTFVRGAGGWGGEREASVPQNVPPERAPDFVVEEKTAENQALLYRLSGDWNPLHADPSFAKAIGYERPILHGLCTFGYATRHVIAKCAPEGDPRYFESIKVRFAKTVFPGETLVTEMWKDGLRVVFRTKVKERDEVVLSHAAITLYETIPAKKEKPKAKVAATAASPTSADYIAVLRDWVHANADTVKAVGKVYLFALKEPDAVWTLDCKAATVDAGPTAKPDCTLELKDADLIAMLKGEKDATKMYFGGELKVSGDVMASQRLDFLSKVDFAKVRASGGGAPESSAEPTSADYIAVLGDWIEANADAVRPIGKTYLFELTGPDAQWTLDCAKASVSAGAAGKADCTLTLRDADFLAMLKGEKDATKMYFGGELKVSGDVMASQRLDFLSKV
ncbi:MAG: SDR family NAD(P)-dependent oxidoreductase, partial [Myxococcota bacterium]